MNFSSDKYFSFREVLFHYQERNAGVAPSLIVHEKPLVFLHGFAQSSDSWSEVVSRFPMSVAYALDWVGHGKTILESTYSNKTANSDYRAELLSCHHQLSFQAQALVSFCENLYSLHQEKLEIVAYSMGGRIALTALVEFPNRFSRCVDTVVLESAGLGLPDEISLENVALINQKRANDLRTLGLSRFIDEWEMLPLFRSQRVFSQEKKAELRKGRMENSAEALALSLEYAGAHTMPLQSEVYRAIKKAQLHGVRFHYFAGEQDVKYVQVAKELEQKGLMSARVFSQMGHNIHWENPSHFSEALSRALVVCS